jgi:uncharacterized membrane protein YeaQ/YmgE (transglycosylase-associated protein family)
MASPESPRGGVYDALVEPQSPEEGRMSILSWIFFGLIAGAVAKLLTPGRDPGGCIITILLGVGGAFVGGALYTWLTGQPFAAGFDLGSFAVAVVGAVVLLLAYRLLTGRA